MLTHTHTHSHATPTRTINNFHKVIVYKINIKINYILITSKEQSTNEIKQTIPFTIASTILRNKFNTTNEIFVHRKVNKIAKIN